MPESDESPLPQPPEIRRRVQLPLFRGIGMAIVVTVPVLALLGVFGDRRTTLSANGSNLVAHVAYPERLRFEVLQHIAITIENRSSQPIDTVTVRLDTAYVLRFSGVSFTPSADEAFVIRLARVMPGESRMVLGEVQGQRYGRHAGSVRIEATSGDTLSIPLRTLVLP